MTPTLGKNQELGSGVLKRVGDLTGSKRNRLTGRGCCTGGIGQDTREPGQAFFYLGQILAEIASSPQPMGTSENKPDTHRRGKG